MTQTNTSPPDPTAKDIADFSQEVSELLSALTNLQYYWGQVANFLSTNAFFSHATIEDMNNRIMTAVNRLSSGLNVLQSSNIEAERKDLMARITSVLKRVELEQRQCDGLSNRVLALMGEVRDLKSKLEKAKKELADEKKKLRPLQEQLDESEKVGKAVLDEKRDLETRLETVEKELLAAQLSLKTWNDQFTEKVNDAVVAEKQRLEEQSKEFDRLQRESKIEKESIGRELVLAQKRVEELEKEKGRLKPQATEKVTDSFFDYLNRLNTAVDAKRWGYNNLPFSRISLHLPFSLSNDSSICYSFNPSDVAFARDELVNFFEGVKNGGTRILDGNVLYSLSRVLGYYNLYVYFSQNDSRIMAKLRDFSIPTSEIEKFLFVPAAVSWLERNKPPIAYDIIPNIPCCVCSNYWNNKEMVAGCPKAIIEMEKQSLLDFRNSLYMAVNVLAPRLSPEEAEKQRQSQLRWVEVTPPIYQNGVRVYTLVLHDSEFLLEDREFEIAIPSGDNDVTLQREGT